MRIDIVGVNGNMGSGKDSLYMNFFGPLGYIRYAFATPLYEIAKLQYDIKCNNSREYSKHSLHNKFVEIAGGKASVSYSDAYTFVEEDLPRIAEETDLYSDLSLDRKPRKFLQQVGTDYFRKQIGENVWCDYLVAKIIADLRKELADYYDSLENEEANLVLIGSGSNVRAVNRSKDFVRKIYVSDLRFENEVSTVALLPNNITYALEVPASARLIKLDVSKDTILQRVEERDMFSKEDIEKTLGHDSEHSISNSMFDIVCDANQPQDILYEDLDNKLKGFL